MSELPFQIYHAKNVSEQPAHIFLGKSQKRGFDGHSRDFYPIEENSCDSVFLFANIVGSKNIKIYPASQDDPFMYIDSRKYLFLPPGFDGKNITKNTVIEPDEEELFEYVRDIDNFFVSGFLTDGRLVSGIYEGNKISGTIIDGNTGRFFVGSGKFISEMEPDETTGEFLGGTVISNEKSSVDSINNCSVILENGLTISNINLIECEISNFTIRNSLVEEQPSDDDIDKSIFVSDNTVIFNESNTIHSVEYTSEKDQVIKFNTINSTDNIIVKDGNIIFDKEGNEKYDEDEPYRHRDIHYSQQVSSPTTPIKIDKNLMKLSISVNSYTDGWVYLFVEEDEVLSNNNVEFMRVVFYSDKRSVKDDVVVEFYDDDNTWSKLSVANFDFQTGLCFFEITTTGGNRYFRTKQQNNRNFNFFVKRSGFSRGEGFCEKEFDEDFLEFGTKGDIQLLAKNYIFVPELSEDVEVVDTNIYNKNVTNIIIGGFIGNDNVLVQTFKKIAGEKCIKIDGEGNGVTISFDDNACWCGQGGPE